MTRAARCLVIFALAGLFSGTSAALEPTDFFGSPDMVSARLSPIGNAVAAIKYHKDGFQRLVLLDPRSGEERVLLNLADFANNEARIRSISWIDNDHVAIQLHEDREGVKDLLDTRRKQHLLIVRVIGDTERVAVFSVKTSGWLVDSLPDQNDVFLYAKSGPYSKIYKLRVSGLHQHKAKLGKLTKRDGGQFIRANEIGSVEGYAVRWFMSKENKPKAVLNYVAGQDLVLNKFDAEMQAVELKTWSREELDASSGTEQSLGERRIIPVAMSNDENSFFCLNFAEEQERSVYKVDFSTGEEELVYEADSFQILDLIISESEGNLIGVKVLKEGEIHNTYLEGEKTGLSSTAEARTSGRIELLLDESGDGQSQLLYAESHDEPGHFVFNEVITARKQVIGSRHPGLLGQLDSRLIDGKVRVEGLEIPYLLSLPNRNAGKPSPLIVFPHGGPIGVFDHRYFDLDTQYLVAKGYAVLRVNFRGSSGYTSELKEAGKRHWGRLMLTDIYSATSKVMRRPDIDAQKICVLGFSYGGYAASMLAIRYPEVYQCAVNVAGVSDINLFLSVPGRSKKQQAWSRKYIGDPFVDYEELKSVSPAYLVEQLERPILVLHGGQDDVVDVEHAYRLRHMLEKYHKVFSWRIFPEATHHFELDSQKVELFTIINSFIAQNLR